MKSRSISIVRAFCSVFLFSMLGVSPAAAETGSSPNPSAATANAPSIETDQPAAPNTPEASEPVELPPQTEVAVSPTGTAEITVLSTHETPVRIGERVKIRLRVVLPEGGQLIAVRPSGNPFVEALSETRASKTQDPILDVTVFRPGIYAFEAEAVWIDESGKQRRIRSEALSLDVRSVIANESEPELADAGPYVLLRSRNIWLIGMSLGVALSALSAALWLLWRRYRQPIALEEVLPPPRPAWEVALEAIAQLRADKDVLENDAIEFHQRLSDILREWLSGRFQLSAVEMTSAEILSELAPRRLELGQWIDEIQSILADTDLVKFAKFSPPAAGSQQLLQQLEQLVLDVKLSDSSPPPAVPAPIEGEPEIIVPAVEAAPQQQQPGAPTPVHTPEHANTQNVIAIDFGRRDKNGGAS